MEILDGLKDLKKSIISTNKFL
jgi:hypothetical protein